ncbi:MAG: hydrogenase maturation nickel metallochaperone HypA [Candidatus Limivicinus sp.]|jgi:hydrogenase nickel incorporation protein HypA/HybF
MHELAIAEGIIDIVNSEAREKGFTKVLEIRLSIGEYSGIVMECIKEFFPIAAAGSPAEHAKFEVQVVKARFRCLDCGYEGEVDRHEACCPLCKSCALKMISGREFYVDSLKVE